MKTILLSFQPEWHDILDEGRMKYEYRKVFPAEPVNAYFYVSSPVQAVCGFAMFGQRVSLLDWCETYRNNLDVLQRINDYLTDCRYAIPIISYQQTASVPICQIRKDIPRFVVPRMYYYLDNQMIQYFESKCFPQGKCYFSDPSQISEKDICCEEWL